MGQLLLQGGTNPMAVPPLSDVALKALKPGDKFYKPGLPTKYIYVSEVK